MALVKLFWFKLRPITGAIVNKCLVDTTIPGGEKM
ncbi:hypothetical protein SM68_03461, partial [Klebsiella pneumoniae]